MKYCDDPDHCTYLDCFTDFCDRKKIMKQTPTLKSTLELCRQLNFNEQITRETLWNTAYSLGRSRWHWGPQWFVSLIGWCNSWKPSQLAFLVAVTAILSALAVYAASKL